MLKKLLFAGVLSLAACIGVRATEYTTISFNFYSGGEIVLDGECPEGISVKPKIRFHNPKLHGYAFPLEINLDKAQSVDLKFNVEGGAGKMEASVSCRATKSGKKQPAPTIKCTKFVLNGEEVPTPFEFKKWKGVKKVMLKDGDTITIKATFEVVK